jgi:hypothetical protein
MKKTIGALMLLSWLPFVLGMILHRFDGLCPDKREQEDKNA